MKSLHLHLLLLGCSAACTSAAAFGPSPALPRPGTPNVTLTWYEAVTDHFAFDVPTGVPSTFKQRVFTYDKYWNKETGAIWFYCGNEANVELYINATGLMWENAEAAGALLVFAEHRYYGETLIFPGDQDKLPTAKMHWLTMEQALADYALVIKTVKETVYKTDQPVVAFGGSYGGMLAAWLRMKYPASVQGAIAASAPILAFGKGYDSNSYWQVVTRDATAEAGAAAGCDTAVRSTWPVIDKYGATDAGRATLSELFKLCTPLKTAADVYNLKLMMLNAWDTMAMGNFPFPSNYLVFQQTNDPSVLLPAFPVRVSCNHMVKTSDGSGKQMVPTDDKTLLSNMRDAAGVFYNVTQNEKCYDVPDDPNYDGIWDYQWCSELLPQETYFTLDGKRDMFWDQPMNMSAIDAHCKGKYGFAPRADWIATEFGGMDGVNAASNIVFTSGLYDPWSSGGVGVKEAAAAKDRVASFGIDGTVKAVVLDHGAHHLDLMFSNPGDTPDVLNARKVELEQIHAWTHPAESTP